MNTLMKRFFLVLLLFVFSGLRQMHAQAVAVDDTTTHNYWFDMMQDPNASFSATQSAFYKYWANRTDYKGNGWKVFKRWEYINESRVLPNGKLQAPGYLKTEYDRYMAETDGTNSASGNWTIVGPTSYPNNNTSQPTGVGRINCIAFHPTDANTIFIGSPSGGFWKTTNGGTSWSNLSNNLATLGVSSILVHPSNPDILYLGSGDRDANDALPLGIFKSTDGGSTWTQINSTMGNVTVGAMIMHPSDPNTILAATSGGIYKTTDGGSSWSQKVSGDFKDIKFKPGDPTIVYAVRITTPSRFYRSSNTGDSWTQITSGIATTGIGSRMVIGVTPANSNYVYLVQILSSNRNFAGLLLSTDAGLNFSTQSTSPNIFDYTCDGSGTASQATYDLCIEVDQTDANIVYVGSINTWKSIDGGVNWTIKTHWIGSTYGTSCAASVHADHHCFAWSPLNGRLYLGHDGGINYTADGGTTWPQITNNLAINQIYRIGQGAGNVNYTLTGQQDNGSAATMNGTTFTTTRGGDGTECIIDYNNSNYCYNTYVEGDIARSVAGPVGSYSNIGSTGTNGIGADESGAWVTPYFLHKSVPSTMFAGYENVWRTTNVQATSASSVTWSAISSGETSTCRILEQSYANMDIVYVVRPGSMKRTDNANADAGSVTWSACTLPGGNTPSDIETHPTDENIVYATAGYYVYKSTDKGATWSSISTGLPSLFTNTIVYNKSSNEGLYVGNQTGVWYKDASMSSWIQFNTGLPPVDIRELELFYDPVGNADKIKAATYGRGLWQSDLYESGIINPMNFTASTTSNTVIDLSWELSSGNDVLVAFNTSPTFGTPENGTAYSTTIPGGGTVLYNGINTGFQHSSLAENTTYYYKIWSYDDSHNYSVGVTANAATLCTLITSFPWIEGFENGGSFSSCWAQEYVSGTNSWAIQTSGINNHPANAHSGTYLARNNTLSSGAGYVTMLVTPALELSSVQAPFLTFWHTQEYWSPNQDELRIYYKTSISGEWNLLTTYTNSISSWTRESISLPEASSTYFIAFESVAYAGYGVCIDDIRVSGSMADFTMNTSVGCTGSLTVNFTDNSIGPNDSWAWDVDNNGTTDYTTQNPSHTYTTQGIYSVRLTVNNGIADTLKKNIILAMNSAPTPSTGCVLSSNSNSGNGYGIGIYRFAIGNIDYTTSNNDGYYNDYSCSKWTALKLNNQNTVTVRTGIYNNEGAKVYIDYNDNGIFSESEAVVSFPANTEGIRSLSFSTPSSGVVMGKGLRLRVLSKFSGVPTDACNVSSYGQAEDYTVYFLNDASWTGATGTDWFTASNWSYGVVPGEGVDVTIPTGLSNYPVVTDDVICGDLTVESGSSLTVDPGNAITLTGEITNQAGNSGLLIKSDASGTGSIIHSTAGVNATFQRFMNNTDWTNWQDGWHFLSSPVASQPVSPAFTTDPYDFYCWYEPQNTWVNYKNTTTAPTWNTANGSTNFITGKGYMAAYDDAGVKSFTGQLNVNDVAVSGLTITGSSQTNRSWHLLGNPFGSALTWDASSAWSLSNIAGVAKIWNESNQAYSDLTSSPSSVIPATNGFMVQVLTGTGSLTLPATKRVHSSQAFYKSELPMVRLTAHNLSAGNAQESSVCFNGEATTGFDPMFDGEFLPGYGPAFYSTAGILKLSTNALPGMDAQPGIPFSFTPNGGNSFSITATGTETVDGSVWLLDKKTGTDQNLTIAPVYAFTATPADDSDRFLLHFNGVGIGHSTPDPGIQIYSYGRTVIIAGALTPGSGANITIYNMLGQIVKQQPVTSLPVTRIDLEGNTGVYIVSVITAGQTLSAKVFIR